MTAQKLPKLKYLRVKNLQTAEAPQAVQLLSRLLACWSSNGVNSEACKEIEQEFKMAACKSVKPVKQQDSINFHAKRLYPKMVPQGKNRR
ncbi:hypothetical protein B0I72DRAFT_31350 [Yarrowia lipolytica]|uniref:Small ribosomal subunit protein mS37 n=2 Tax=Yarrowia lipolytica TaxID=4952 RepID=Q6C291_YARLI|nr:YALI0F09768p [Yarrowia lipolytica CLIB122]AOW06923.1 hypothetical protein YALI1_F13366g [Yarrowia lipolytica]KAB8284024.1 hypothetical protein BKA91DRAFT_8106 [Yarrowia lipolytica]KAE8173611.1 hypothetical protein BKA90DRAFT_5824 [Yarrowia lipolytica]KAJ8055897.1 hypothetical protein LXG23DRAFT_57428 [Yarrowia lipolytica]QNQ01240.1 37S ribosomal protein MRP10 [Yarrowia lipolytica]|eukprot:XP_505221.1 YALI0F09768p [Yarrowia lipolytica CLIB122]